MYKHKSVGLIEHTMCIHTQRCTSLFTVVRTLNMISTLWTNLEVHNTVLLTAGKCCTAGLRHVLILRNWSFLSVNSSSIFPLPHLRQPPFYSLSLWVRLWMRGLSTSFGMIQLLCCLQDLSIGSDGRFLTVLHSAIRQVLTLGFTELTETFSLQCFAPSFPGPPTHPYFPVNTWTHEFFSPSSEPAWVSGHCKS